MYGFFRLAVRRGPIVADVNKQFATQVPPAYLPQWLNLGHRVARQSCAVQLRKIFADDPGPHKIPKYQKQLD